MNGLSIAHRMKLQSTLQSAFQLSQQIKYIEMNSDHNPDSLSYSGVKKNNIYLIAFVLILLIFITHSIYLSVVAEDAFISFRYAKNLVNGFGLVWNIMRNKYEEK